MESSDFKPSYIGRRDDILNLLPGNVRKVLDVGCSTGALGEQIKEIKHAEVFGIEANEEMAKVAKKKLDRVIMGDAEKIKLADYLSPNYFDCVIFADILEHLKDPWRTLERYKRFLNDDGIIIASIPNARHYT